MQRFSLATVIGTGRKDTTGSSSGSDGLPSDARPSVATAVNLNKQLNVEIKKNDVHLFFGPLDGKDRALHGERKIQKNAKKFWLMSEPLSLDRDSTSSVGGVTTEPQAKSGGVASALSAAGRYLGQKVAQLKPSSTHVNEDSFCDGCGMDPIIGNMYTCSTCDNYSLCESCYQAGIHGYEDSELLKNVREDFALRLIVERCKHKVPEKVFEVLMKKVCKGQVDKFNFLAKWISGLVLGKPLHELSVRGIEIPHLDFNSRTTLVELLTPVLAERTDVEVCMEWFSPDASNDLAPAALRKLETLRIWVATDKHSKSPFASSKDSLKEEDTESDSPSSVKDGLLSPGPGSPTQPFSPGTRDFMGSPPTSPQSPAPDGFSPPASPRSPPLDGESPPLSPQFASMNLDETAYLSDSDGRSESSVIVPQIVEGGVVSESGERSEGIQM